MDSNRVLIKGGTVVSMDPTIGDLDTGDVLVEGSKIASVQKDIQASDCEVIDASNAIVIPGLVDTHRHLWQTALRGLCTDWTLSEYGVMVRTGYCVAYEPDDAFASGYAGALEAINAGVTTVVDHSHLQLSPEHSDALVTASLEAGIRGFFCYGLYNNPSYTPGDPIDVEKIQAQVMGHSEKWHFENAIRIRKRYFNESNALLRFGIATSEFSLATSIEHIEAEIADMESLEPELITAHWMATSLAENLEQRPVGSPWIREMEERNLLKSNMLFSHLNNVNNEEFDILARNGVSMSATPETELSMQIGDPVLEPARKAGMQVSMGMDTCILIPGDMFGQARMLLHLERAREFAKSGEPIPKLGTVTPTARDYLEITTSGGAIAAGLGNVTGSLTPGKEADIVMISTDSLNMCPVNSVTGAVIFQANVSDVDTVLIAGKIRKRHGKLVGVNLASVRDKLNTAHERITEKIAKVPRDALVAVWAPLMGEQ